MRSNNTLANQFVSNIKKVFVKCTRRKRLYKEVTNLPLPPEPNVTRWNTWLECVFYCCQHFEMLSNFICNNLDKTESRAIEILQDLVNNPLLQSELAYLSSQFSKVTCILDKLQGRLLLSETVKTVDLFEDCLEEEYKDKFTRVLERNPDWETVRKIGKILSGEANVAINIPPDVICNFKFAPIVSVDVERCFRSSPGFLVHKDNDYL